jgi:hypothetical protein
MARPHGWGRHPIGREDFDRRTRRFEELYPELSVTSGKRSRVRNEAVGAKGQSHVKGLGKDYGFDEGVVWTVEEIAECYQRIKTLGLWGYIHKGQAGGLHVHVQGEPPA